MTDPHGQARGIPRVAHERLQRCARLPNGLHLKYAARHSAHGGRPTPKPPLVERLPEAAGFGQVKQARVIAKTFRPADLYQIGAQAAVIIAGRN